MWNENISSCKPIMLFKALSFPIPSTVYSIAYVKKKEARNKYIVEYKKIEICVQTQIQLEIGQWIRFYGRRMNEKDVCCDYVEILNGFDVNIVTEFFKL